MKYIHTLRGGLSLVIMFFLYGLIDPPERLQSYRNLDSH